MDERKISHERPKGGRRGGGGVGLFIPLLQIYLFIILKKKNSRLKLYIALLKLTLSIVYILYHIFIYIQLYEKGIHTI